MMYVRIHRQIQAAQPSEVRSHNLLLCKEQVPETASHVQMALIHLQM